MSEPLGVGILGAGPVTQSIHLPVIAGLADRLRVVHVMDVDARVCAEVAQRVDARASSTVDAVLDDPAVDIVAICSPHQFHADQVAAACTAGKRAVLCEKPLATSLEDAQRVMRSTTGAGVPLVVGAMHAYDPGWVGARDYWEDAGADATVVRSVIYLPSNDDMIGLATDPVPAAPAAPPTDAGPAADPVVELDADLERLRGGIIGLAIHAIPLVRRLIPKLSRVTSARVLEPFGYLVTVADNDDRVAQLIGLMPGRWRPDWSLDAWGANGRLHADFPPSFVLAGSATAQVRIGDQSRSWRYPENGYQAEWRHLADIVREGLPPPIPVQDAVDDVSLALTIADGAVDLIREGR
jgi:predicted dehydrogenase